MKDQFTNKEGLSIRFRLPNGKVIAQKFDIEQPIKQLYDFVFINMSKNVQFKLKMANESIENLHHKIDSLKMHENDLLSVLI